MNRNFKKIDKSDNPNPRPLLGIVSFRRMRDVIKLVISSLKPDDEVPEYMMPKGFWYQDTYRDIHHRSQQKIRKLRRQRGK